MRRIPKFFVGFIMAICLLLGVLALTACGTTSESGKDSGSTSASTSDSTGEELNGYKFTVLYPDETPVEGVRIQLCIDELCKIPVKTNAEGVAIITYDATVYDIHIMEDTLPEGYTFDNNAFKTPAEYSEITLHLVAVAE